MNVFQISYDFWLTLLETALVILIINMIIRIGYDNNRILLRLFEIRKYIYRVIILLIGFTALFFTSLSFYRYWPWFIVAITVAAIYFTYRVYRWMIKSDHYNMWFEAQVDNIHDKLMNLLAKLLNWLPNTLVLKRIKIRVLEELMRFDLDNRFEEQVLAEIYALDDPKRLVELSRKFRYWQNVHSTSISIEIIWPNGQTESYPFNSIDYLEEIYYPAAQEN